MTVSLISGVGVSQDSKDAWNDEEVRSKVVSLCQTTKVPPLPPSDSLASFTPETSPYGDKKNHQIKQCISCILLRRILIKTDPLCACITLVVENYTPAVGKSDSKCADQSGQSSFYIRSYFVAAQSALESFPDFSFCLIADD